MRIAYWRSKSVRILRQCAANCKKSRRNTNWKLKTLQIWTPLPIDAKMHRCVNILCAAQVCLSLILQLIFLSFYAAFGLFVRTLPIDFALLGRKRKYIKSKTTGKFKGKQTLNAAVRDQFLSFATFPTPLPSRQFR
jgi:hypothetical protein